MLTVAARCFSGVASPGGDDDDAKRSRYANVYWHKRASRWIADLRVSQRRVLSKSFPPDQEKVRVHVCVCMMSFFFIYTV